MITYNYNRPSRTSRFSDSPMNYNRRSPGGFRPASLRRNFDSPPRWSPGRVGGFRPRAGDFGFNNHHPPSLSGQKRRFPLSGRGASPVEYKLFADSLNKQASVKEVEEVFSKYGLVEDVYLMHDDKKLSRGCGFVKYSRRDMALAAINALNGIYKMRGCDQPLIVRFADPKKPRQGDSRGPAFGPRFDAPGTRLPSNNSDPMGDHMPPPNAWRPIHQPNTGPSFNAGFHGMGPPLIPRSGDMALPLNAGGPMIGTGLSINGRFQAQSPSAMPQQSQWGGSGTVSQAATGTHVAAPAADSPSSTSSASSVQEISQNTTLAKCNWTEHLTLTKYYYNSVSGECRWEKPKELTLFEQQQHRQSAPQSQIQSQPSIPPTQQIPENQQARPQSHFREQVTRDRDIFDKWCRYWGVIYKDEKEKAYRFRNFQKALKPPPEEELTSHNYPGLADRTQEELDGRSAYMFQYDIDSMIEGLEEFAKLRKDSAGQKYINTHSDPKVASLSDREIFDKWCQIWEVTYTGQKEREYRFRIFRKALRPSKTPKAVCPNFPNLADRTKGELNGISAYVFDFDIDGMFDDPAYNTK